MKKTNENRSTRNRALGLIRATGLWMPLITLFSAGAALADGSWGHSHRERGAQVSGSVVVTKEIPGGIITVGATVGRPRPVVVEERKVVVIEKEDRCDTRQVTVIRKEPVRKVVVVREAPTKTVIIRKAPEKRIIVVKEGKHGRSVKKVVTYHDHGNSRHGHGKGNHQHLYARN